MKPIKAATELVDDGLTIYHRGDTQGIRGTVVVRSRHNKRRGGSSAERLSSAGLSWPQPDRSRGVSAGTLNHDQLGDRVRSGCAMIFTPAPYKRASSNFKRAVCRSKVVIDSGNQNMLCLRYGHALVSYLR